MTSRLLAVLAVLVGGSLAFAQDDDLPSAQDLAEASAKRFPQPVRVGDLVGHYVLEPIESQPVLGRVHAFVRQPDGTIAVVVDYGGFLGFFSRPIAVPVNGMVLLGQNMEIADFEPEQLDKFPTFSVTSAKSLLPSTIIRVGLARPSH